jgi:hypothetical protein
MITVPATGDQRVDKAFQIVCSAIVKLSDAISSLNTESGALAGNLEKKFELINAAITGFAESFETGTLKVGDITGGNYVEIKETGEIELHGTNTLQINSGELYLKNGTTVERIRVENGQFYIENQTAPSTWKELVSFF